MRIRLGRYMRSFTIRSSPIILFEAVREIGGGGSGYSIIPMSTFLIRGRTDLSLFPPIALLRRCRRLSYDAHLRSLLGIHVFRPWVTFSSPQKDIHSSNPPPPRSRNQFVITSKMSISPHSHILLVPYIFLLPSPLFLSKQLPNQPNVSFPLLPSPPQSIKNPKIK